MGTEAGCGRETCLLEPKGISASMCFQSHERSCETAEYNIKILGVGGMLIFDGFTMSPSAGKEKKKGLKWSRLHCGTQYLYVVFKCKIIKIK